MRSCRLDQLARHLNYKMAIVAAEHWNWSKFVRKDDTGATALEVLTSKIQTFRTASLILIFFHF